VRGWNGSEAYLAHDASWAVDEVVRRYGDVPVCLAGIDMGARAALRSAGHEAVNSVWRWPLGCPNRMWPRHPNR
jgi:hypothetical protein